MKVHGSCSCGYLTFEAEGAQPAERMTPEQLRATIAREYLELEQTVKRLNIKIE